jgi:hypothetical protein
VPAQTSSSSPQHGGRSERLTGAPLIYAAMGTVENGIQDVFRRGGPGWDITSLCQDKIVSAALEQLTAEGLRGRVDEVLGPVIPRAGCGDEGGNR